jgi:hypothetical protein
MKHLHDESDDKAMQTPGIYAARYALTLRPAADPLRMKGVITAFLEGLAASLAAAGCTAVGHIKGSARASKCEVLAFSLTTLTGVPRWHGSWNRPADKCVVTLNLIVFGLNDESLEDLVAAQRTKFLPSGVNLLRRPPGSQTR